MDDLTALDPIEVTPSNGIWIDEDDFEDEDETDTGWDNEEDGEDWDEGFDGLTWQGGD